MWGNSWKQKADNPKGRRAILKKLQPYWKNVSEYKSLVLSLAFFYVITAAISLAPAFLQRKIFDFAIPNQDVPALVYILAAVVFINAVVFGFNLISELLLTLLTENNRLRMKRKLFRKLLCLPYPFHALSKPGEVHKLSDDGDRLSNVPRIYMADFLRNSIIILIYYPILFLLSYKLTLIRLAGFPLELLAGRYFQKKDKELEKQLWEKQRRVTSLINQSHSGARTLKSLQGESEIYRQLRAAQLELKEVHLQRRKTASLWKGLNRLLSQILGSLVFFLAAWDIIHGSFSFGSFIAFNIINSQGSQALSGFVNAYKSTGVLQNSADRYEGAMSLPEEITIPANSGYCEKLAGNIEFRGVSFRYSGNMPALDNVSFQIREHSHTALVGPSGSGKTTVANLLLGLYIPQQGEIRVGNRPLRQYSLHSLRGSVAVVPQETFLFEASIRDNLTLGSPVRNNRQIREALIQANAAEFVDALPAGLDTLYGTSGITLSGGQKQRLSIARLFLRNPSIIILDEATSSQDMESERLIQNALERLRRGRTTITIAHRLNTVARADMILVLDRGRIVQAGEHEQLMQEEGLYRQLFLTQEMHYG